MFLISTVLILAVQAVSFANEIKQNQELENQCGSHTSSVVKPLIDHLAKMSTELQLSEAKDREINELKSKQEINETLIKELRSQIQFQISIINRLIENTKTENISSFMVENQTLIQMQLEESSEKLHTQMCKDKADKIDSNLLTSCTITSLYRTNYIAVRYLTGLDAFYVPCDYQLGSPGWMVIQQRIDGRENFTQDWATYRAGFGYSDDSDYFLGLEKIHRLTSSRCYELHLHLEFANGSISYAHYDDFRVSDEVSGYAITVGAFSGNTTDMLNGYNNVKFSTFDRRNENLENMNYTRTGKISWWFGSCAKSNLNGMADDFNWDSHILRKAKMLMRPTEIK